MLLIESILESYETYKKEPYYNDFGYVSYDFLKGIGVIDFNNDTKAEILEKAREKAVENLNNRLNKDKTQEQITEIRNTINSIKLDKTGKDSEVINCCKNIGLTYYYDYILENNISLEDEIQKALNNGR